MLDPPTWLTVDMCIGHTNRLLNRVHQTVLKRDRVRDEDWWQRGSHSSVERARRSLSDVEPNDGNSYIRLSRCEICGGLVRDGAPCRRCEERSATLSPATSARRRNRLILGLSAAMLVVAVVLGVVLSGVLRKPTAEAYYESLADISLRLAQSSQELVPLLNDFGDWDERELIRMLALTGVMFDTCEKARGLTCPVEAADAHALLLKAVYYYDLACQQTRAFIRQTGQTGGFPDPGAALDASRSLYEGDRMRILAQAEVKRLTRSSRD